MGLTSEAQTNEARPTAYWEKVRSLNRKKIGIDDRRAVFLALGLIMTTALVLRIFRLENSLIYSDEAFSWRVSTCDVPDLVERVAGDVHPIGYFLILKTWLSTIGSSPVEMRMLSVIFGLATVLMVFRLCVDAVGLRYKSGNCGSSRYLRTAYAGPLFASTLIAIHASQLAASRIARMYSLSAFLAAASSWCLLKALYAPTRKAIWWTAYAVLAAVSLHSHNYAVFMVASQFLYIALILGGIFPCNLNIDRPKTVRPAAMAICSVAFLYAPWVPTFLQQASRVQQNFWLPDVSVTLLAESFATWLTGLRGGDATWFAAVWMAFFLMMTVYTVSQRDEIGLFFLLQALIPWIATLLMSTLGGRPLLDERYLVFAQVALLTYWGYACAQLPTLAIGLLVALNLLIPTTVGTYEFVASIPSAPPSITRAIEFIQKAYRPSDVIIAPGARDVNIFKYYASQAGWHEFDLRCPHVEHKTGHVNHISSLSPDDWLWKHEPPKHVRQIWTINRPAWNRTDEWAETSSDFFTPMDRTWAHGLLIRRFKCQPSSD